MDLLGINIATKSAFAAEYAAQGILVISTVDLPSTFQPRVTDVIFLAVDGSSEVYLDARVAYVGEAPCWQEIMRQIEAPGHARLVVACVDFFSAFRAFSNLLANEQQAGPEFINREKRFAWLQTLGLSGNPTLHQIKKAYRKLALIHHPDRLAGASASELKAAEDQMKRIVEAHHALMNPRRSCLDETQS